MVVDAVGDLVTAASDSQRLHDYLYSLVQHFAVNGVTSVLTLRVGTIGSVLASTSPSIASATCPTTCSRWTCGGEERTRRTIRVVKTRNSDHDPVVRELAIRAGGARIV